MVIDWNTPLAQASDEQIRAALQEANIPALMAALVHLAGNADPLQLGIQPLTVPLAETEDGLDEDTRQRARQLAFSLICGFRDNGCQLPAAPDEATVTATMHYITGQPMQDEYFAMLREELSLFGEDGRAVEVDRHADDERNFKALIIGAGMSGILAAVRLEQQGVDYVLIEKNPCSGGTWYENTYPGCRVDSPNHLYSYMFARKTDWPSYFSTKPTLFEYFADIAGQYGISQRIRFNTRVTEARYREDSCQWYVTVEDNTGEQCEMVADIVISATGQLNVPNIPALPGLQDFRGIAFHSARWEAEHQLAGKRVCVIGTGASATQIVPELAAEGIDITLLQRSPPWIIPTQDYHQEVTPGQLWLFQQLPFYARWYRFWLFRRDAADGVLPMLYRDPDWTGRDDAISAQHDELRAAMTEFIREQLAADPELLKACIPDYPPCGKRPLRDDGTWLSSLLRDNVTLVTDPIERVTEHGIQTRSGKEYPADVIIFATGFQADHFLCTLDVIGRGGTRLAQQWATDPRAYMGMTIPNFPNLFCMYGPNTNIVVGSSIVFFSECSMRYVMGAIKLMVEEGYRSLECRRDVHDRYNEKIDAWNATTAWGAPNVDSWYKNASGRVTQNWPGSHYQWWQQTLAPNPEDFIIK